jgi:protein-L-isoaspartate(D-aspartate) O-methyltransferase
MMTEKLDIGEDAKVLEVGTGSGYQTAILAELAREVWSIEIIPALAESAPRLLIDLGYTNIHAKRGDGYAGWPEQAPFDGIMVTASAPRVPHPLVEQLRVGAHLIVPVENDLLRVTRGRWRNREEWLCNVTFVPMTGGIRN